VTFHKFDVMSLKHTWQPQHQSHKRIIVYLVHIWNRNQTPAKHKRLSWQHANYISNHCFFFIWQGRTQS